MFCWLVSSLKHSAWWWVWIAGVTSACCPVIFSVNTMRTVGFNCKCNKCLLSCHFYDERSMATVGLNGRKGQVPVVLSFLWSTHHDDNGFELHAWWVPFVLSFLWSTHCDDSWFELQVWWVPVVLSFLLLGPASEKVTQSARLCLALWGLWPHGPLCESTFFVWGWGGGWVDLRVRVIMM